MRRKEKEERTKRKEKGARSKEHGAWSKEIPLSVGFVAPPATSSLASLPEKGSEPARCLYPPGQRRP